MANLGYARVSTREQDAQNQVGPLHAAGCERVWVEVASGYKDSRPQLDDLLAYARKGDVLTVWRLDRLGRSVQHLLRLAVELQEHGIELRSLSESIDTTTATGKLTFTLFAAMAEFEGNLRRERQQAAWAAGKQKGRPTVVDPDKLALALRLKEEGRSYAEVSRLVGVSKTTIFRALDSVAGAQGCTTTGTGVTAA